jgi:hypothetical protein
MALRRKKIRIKTGKKLKIFHSFISKAKKFKRLNFHFLKKKFKNFGKEEDDLLDENLKKGFSNVFKRKLSHLTQKEKTKVINNSFFFFKKKIEFFRKKSGRKSKFPAENIKNLKDDWGRKRGLFFLTGRIGLSFD